MNQQQPVKYLRLIALNLAFALAGVAYAQEEAGKVYAPGEERAFHTIEAVPAAALSVARKNAPDVVFTAAESYWEDDDRVYRISGRLYSEVWQVYVTEQGRFLYSESDLQDD